MTEPVGLPIDKDDVPESYISLMHPTSEAVSDGKFQQGEIVVMPDGINLTVDGEAGCQIVPVYFIKDRWRAPEGQPDCQGHSFKDEAGALGVWKGRYGNCAVCKHNADENNGRGSPSYHGDWKEACTYRYTHIVRILKFAPEYWDHPPYLNLQLAKGAVLGRKSTAKLWNMHIQKDGGLPYKGIYNVKAVQKTRKATNTKFWAFEITRIGKNEDLEMFQGMFLDCQKSAQLQIAAPSKSETVIEANIEDLPFE